MNARWNRGKGYANETIKSSKDNAEMRMVFEVVSGIHSFAFEFRHVCGFHFVPESDEVGEMNTENFISAASKIRAIISNRAALVCDNKISGQHVQKPN